MDGINGSILCYGQTSSGKTHTMTGSLEDEQLKGLMPRISEKIFREIEESPSEIEFAIKVSYCEIYMERIIDLLDPVKNNLPVLFDKNKGVVIDGLTERYACSTQDILNFLFEGNTSRKVAETNMNARSSRSHSVFIVNLEQKSASGTKNGKLYMIDLAGSEKASKTGLNCNQSQRFSLRRRKTD